MGKESHASQRSFEFGGRIRDAVCFGEGEKGEGGWGGMKTQDLMPLPGDDEKPLFQNDYGDVFEYDPEQDVYHLVKKEASEPMRSEMRRLQGLHPDWPESRVRENAKINVSEPVVKNKRKVA
jgi:hypothetical protein